MSINTVLFDINETVLDLAPLKQQFSNIFAHSLAAGLWFSRLLHQSTVCNITHVNSDFSQLAELFLDGLIAGMGMAVTKSQRMSLLSTFSQLKCHQDVVPALAYLKHQGITSVAFSNSSNQLLQRQLVHAGLLDKFDSVLSVQASGKFKPDPQAYCFAATELNKNIEQMCLVATHDWDCHGALSAGMQAGYVARGKAPYSSIYKQPQARAENLTTLLSALIKN